MGKRIEVVIDDMGEVKIEAFGYTGGACVKETEELENDLGGTPKRKLKPEARGVVKPARSVDQSA